MSAPFVVRTVADLRAAVTGWRARGERIALVPTMGALHAGHLSLVETGRSGGARSVVSIFVNPTQFAPTEDFSSYPRTFEHDLALLGTVGADLVYAPSAGTMYPAGFATTVSAGGPAKAGLEDAFRPHFFDGVATVVAKLLLQGLPDRAIFGEKDFQQLQVVRTMARDLDLPVEIVGAPTVRDADGVALSSRNVYLSAAEREAAATLPRVMRDTAAALREADAPRTLIGHARAALERAGFVLDYLDWRDSTSLGLPVPSQPSRLLVAATLGRTRLIDNWPV